MIITLHIRYRTRYGQALHAIIGHAGEITNELAMAYADEESWKLTLDSDIFSIRDDFRYNYVVKEPGVVDITDKTQRQINLNKIKAGTLNIYDEWQEEPLFENVFRSKPFDGIFSKNKKAGKKDKPKKYTHIFKVMMPHMHEDKVVCVTGSGGEMGEWDEEEPVLMHYSKGCWTAFVNLQKETFPVNYKFGIYDINEKRITRFEGGDNRVIYNKPGKNTVTLTRCFPVIPGFRWQGTGINVPVSALKTKESWGVGDFTSLHLLIDWAQATGIRMVQLLPVNDTTATHSAKDSYPYASISAFALHPMYLNVKKLAAAASVQFPKEMVEEIAKLNDASSLDYESVSKIKSEAIRQLYYKEKHSFKDDFAFFEFFDLNRNWLVPYAAFCYLRDLNNSPDPETWEDYNVYNEDAIQELASKDNAHYDEIAIHYFTQYHLHLQLLDAVEYAHKHGVILKGDLPIGVGRYSAETWMRPSLFHMDMQAGAPPDAFAVKGQNWEFPTYNWEEMAKDNYAWWRQRMEHMSNYFDAIRIDHILGFFRIWSIPKKDVEGILGIFVPSLPLSIDALQAYGVHFDENRLCRPYISESILSRHFPGNEQWVKDNLLDGYKFRPSLDTQQKIAAFLKKHPEKATLQQGLFDLVTDVILLPDTNPGHYHCRINMHLTDSFRNLDHLQQQHLNAAYQQYFFSMQDELWKQVGQEKLNALQLNTDMLLCAEDLGMVPDFVEDVLKNREILSLQVQRMPKKIGENFSHPRNAIYLSVVTPSTHDMSTIRQWWEEDKESTQYFYNSLMGQQGSAPYYCEPWVCKEIIRHHLESPAMWAVFLIQDILSMDDKIRRENPAEERINIPADPDHTWDYRMHVTLEDLLQKSVFNDSIKAMIKQSQR